MLVICVQFGRALKNSFFSFFSLPIRAFGRWSFLIFWCGWKAMDIVMPLYCSSRNLFLRKLLGSAVDKHFFERVPVGDYSSLSIGLTLWAIKALIKNAHPLEASLCQKVQLWFFGVLFTNIIFLERKTSLCSLHLCNLTQLKKPLCQEKNCILALL